MSLTKFETGDRLALDDQRIDQDTGQHDALRDPSVLIAASNMLVDRYGEPTEVAPGNTFVFTPQVQLNISSESETNFATVFAGRNIQDYGLCNIYVKTPDQRDPAVWIVFDTTNKHIADGKGHLIVDPADLHQVRNLVDALDQEYRQALTSKTDEFDIRGYSLHKLDEHIAATEATLDELRRQRSVVMSETTPINMYQVSIESAWRREGENDYCEIIPASSLSDAIRHAVERFKQINNRGDVQARDVRVSATTDGKTLFDVPREVTMPLFRVYSRHDREASALTQLAQI